MRMLRFFVIILVIFCFIFLSNTHAMEFSTALPPIRLSSLLAKISPPHANEPVHYSFEYKVPNFHDIHDWMEICFPPGTQFQPPLPLEGKERQDRLIQITDAIYFEGAVYSTGCRILQGLPIITMCDDTSIWIRFSLPFELDRTTEQWNTLTIHFSPEAGIVTPANSGDIAFSIRTESSPQWKTSAPIQVIALDPGKARLYLSNPYTDMNSVYLVECIAGKGKFDLENPILVRFAQEVYMPHTIRLEDIQMNGEKPDQISLDDHTFSLYPATPIHEGEKIRIVFCKELYIVNPSKSGTIVVEVANGLEGELFLSQPFSILQMPYPRVYVIIDPPHETSTVDFMVKMVFHPEQIPHIHDQIEINLGVYGCVYTEILKENPNNTVLIAFYYNRPIETGYYTLKMKWKDKTATCTYSIPFEDESIFLSQQHLGKKESGDGEIAQDRNRST
ncbi:MAG: hypothetical protein PHX86_05920 [Caldisericia bacterium]|nr:hypothetical protein [Caldisericia bacterium]